MGRPTALTPDVHATIVRALRAGAYLREGAGMAGVAERTVYQWLQRGEEAIEATEVANATAEREAGTTDSTDEAGIIEVPTDDPAWVYAQFAQAVMEARAQARVAAVATLKAAVSGAPAVFDEHGNVIVAERPPEWRAALEFLARTDPEHWGRGWRRDPIEKTPPATAIEDQVGSMDDEKSAAFAGLDELEALRNAKAV